MPRKLVAWLSKLILAQVKLQLKKMPKLLKIILTDDSFEYVGYEEDTLIRSILLGIQHVLFFLLFIYFLCFCFFLNYFSIRFFFGYSI